MNTPEKIRATAAHFFGGKDFTLEENRSGHINSTYFVNSEDGRFVLQKINKNVFTRPEEVMANIAAVTSHIRKKLIEEGKDPDRGVLSFLDSDTGKNFYTDDEGEYWRAYRYIDGVCLNTCDSLGVFAKAGVAFGEFQSYLADFDAGSLFETIKDFHNTEKRYEDLMKAASEDVAGRAASVESELHFAYTREEHSYCIFIPRGIAYGDFRLRVTHNDTKLNNVILDRETGEGLCVIDLDTVMPGSLLYDFGDAVRFGASSAKEDEADLRKVRFLPEMFAAFAEGYVKGLHGAATRTEILAFPQAAAILTFETGIRFLTDYLSGDTYFRTEYPEHNLVRARNQFKLVESIEEQEDMLDIMVRKLADA